MLEIDESRITVRSQCEGCVMATFVTMAEGEIYNGIENFECGSGSHYSMCVKMWDPTQACSPECCDSGLGNEEGENFAGTIWTNPDGNPNVTIPNWKGGGGSTSTPNNTVLVNNLRKEQFILDWIVKHLCLPIDES